MSTQIDLFEYPESRQEFHNFISPDLDNYDFIVVAFSGGKDSQAALLYLLEEGVDPSRIELWHHCVDGKDNDSSLMDWPVTEDYCRKFARAFGLPIYFSWKVGGFLGEMLRQDEFTKPVCLRPYDSICDSLVEVAMNPEFVEPIFIKNWSMPSGAFGDSAGPV